MARTNRQRPPKRKGISWLILFLIIGGAFCLFIFAPQALREAIGIRDAGGLRDGEMELPARGASVDTHARETDTAAREVAVDTQARREAADAQQTDDRETAANKLAQTQAQSKDAVYAEAAIADARALLEAFRWGEAESRAAEVASMAVDADAMTTAKRIILNARSLEELFARLELRDELTRNNRTHPLLVSFDGVGGPVEAYPLTALTSDEAPDTEDPVAWVEARLTEDGKVAMQLVKGGSTEFKQNQIRSRIRPADRQRIMEEARSVLERQTQRLRSDPNLSDDPLAWYEAAKYAYRHRLDEQVVPMLEQAIELDPLLASTIKEDKAKELYLGMVASREQGNDAAVNARMSQLRRLYEDTNVFAQAEAYYKRELATLRLARTEAADRERERIKQREQERLKRAEALRDEQAAERIRAQAREQEEELAAAPVPTGNGDSSEADSLMQQASDLYRQANAMGVCAERDELYSKAIPLFSKARDLYYEVGNEEAATRAHMFRYGCIKNRRTL